MGDVDDVDDENENCCRSGWLLSSLGGLVIFHLHHHPLIGLDNPSSLDVVSCRLWMLMQWMEDSFCTCHDRNHKNREGCRWGRKDSVAQHLASWHCGWSLKWFVSPTEDMGSSTWKGMALKMEDGMDHGLFSRTSTPTHRRRIRVGACHQSRWGTSPSFCFFFSCVISSGFVGSDPKHNNTRKGASARVD